MERVTILELYRKTRNRNVPLFGDPEDLGEFDFMAEYLNKYARLDRNFAKTHVHFAPVWNLNYEPDADAVLEAFRQDVTDVINKNANDYGRLWAALVEATYNPIENYDRYEEIINDFGATRHTDTIGATRKSKEYGATERTAAYGQERETNAMGAQSNTKTVGGVTTTKQFGAHVDQESIGQRTDAATHYMQGFNSTNPNETNSDSNVNGAQANSMSYGAHSDSESMTGRTDGEQLGAHSDSLTKDAHTDKISDKTHTDIEAEDQKINTGTDDARRDEVHNHTHGNIGVTSAEQLLTQEVALRLAHRFYEILFNDIIDELCILVDDSDYGAFSVMLRKKPSTLRELAQYDDFTMYVDEESGLYVVYENGAAVPSFRYDQESGNLYIVNQAGFEITLRYDAESGNLYRVED